MSRRQIHDLYEALTSQIPEEWNLDEEDFRSSVAKIFENSMLLGFSKWYDYLDDNIFFLWKSYSEEYKEDPVTTSFQEYDVIGMIINKHPELRRSELELHTDDYTVKSVFSKWLTNYV